MIEKLCCEEENSNIKELAEWSSVYDEDIEIYITAGKHTLYLCCVCREVCRKKYVCQFVGTKISIQLLNYLEIKSLTCSSNRKYDVYFFIRELFGKPISHNVLAVTFKISYIKYQTRYNKKTRRSKTSRANHFTFSNDYSIIN